MNISNASSYRLTYSPPATAKPTLTEKVGAHFEQKPMDAVFTATEALYVTGSAFDAAGDLNGLFDGATAAVGVVNLLTSGVQALRARKTEGEEKITTQLQAAGSFLKGFGMIGASSNMGPLGLAIYGVGVATSIYADVR